MLKEIYFRLIVVISASIGWFGFILPYAVSCTHTILVVAGLMITLLVVIPWLFMSIRTIIIKCVETINKRMEQ